MSLPDPPPVSRDITERKQAEEKIRVSEERLNLLHQITSNPTFGDAARLQSLLRLGCEQFDLENGLVGEVTGDIYKVALAISHDNSILVGFSCPLEDALCVEVLRRNDLLAVENVGGGEWRGHRAHSVFGTEVYFGVPINVDGRVFGTLCFTSPKPRETAFTRGDEEFLRLLANTLGAEMTRQHFTEQLREKTHFLDRITAVTPDVLYVLDITDYHFKWVSPQAAIRFGYSAEEILAMGADFMPRAMHPDDLARMPAHFAELARAADGQTLEIEYRLRHPDGSWRWFGGRKTPFTRDADGRVREIMGTSVDITARKQAEQALADRTELLNGVLEGTTDVIFAKDRNGRMLLANAAFAAAAGSTPEQLVGKTDEDWFPPDVAAAVRQQDEAVIARGSPMQIEETIPVGGEARSFLTLKAPLRDGSGRVVGILGIGRDITERKKAEERLRASEARLRRVFESNVVGMIRWDLDRSLIVDANAEFLRMTGYVRDDITSGRLNFRDLTPPEWTARNEEGIRAIQAHGNASPYEKEFFKKDGSRLPIIIAGTRFEDSPSEGISFLIDLTEMKHAGEALARLAAIVESSHDALFSEDLDGIVLSWNRGAEQIFGYRANEIVGTSILRLIPEARQAEEHEFQRKLAAGERGGTFETTRLRKDGLEFHASITISPLKDAAGKVIGTSRVVRDITERRQAEAVLRQNAELFTALIEQAPMGTYVVDAEFRMRQINAEALPAFAGVQPLIGRDFYEVLEIVWGPDLAGQLAGIFRHTLATGEPYISPPFTEKRHDLGITQTYEWQTQRVTLPDGAMGVVCYFHEVTERTRATEALRASQERMRLAAEATGVGIWEWNVLTNAVHWDAVMFAIYGITPTPEGLVQYSDWSGAVLPEDLAHQEKVLQEAVRTGGRSSREFRIRRAGDGESRIVRSVEATRQNSHGQVEWVVGTNLDFTDRVQAEEALSRLAAELSEADRRKNEFLATLAHELRNPLAPIRNGLQIMKLAQFDSATVEKSCSMMERQVEQMTRLIDDLMDVSRINQGKLQLQMTRMSLADAVRNAVDASRPLIDALGHELVVDVPPEPIDLDADLTRLSQVFANLLNNAAKYTDRGGRIRLAVERQGNDVVVSVADNGVGIPADMLARVFDLFAQIDGSLERSQGGLGIGLNIAKRLVEKHGGGITAESGGPGMGSTFTVRLPVALTVTADRPDERNNVQKAKPARRRILVVDDNVDSASSLAMILDIMGNETQTAPDGLEAIAVAEAFKPDVILMDIGMPKVNGHEACRRIREQPWGRNIVIVAQTGWGHEDDKRKSQEAGFDFHMVKPVDPAALEKMLAGPG